MEDRIETKNEKHGKEACELRNSADVNLEVSKSVDSKIEDDKILEMIEGHEFEIKRLIRKIK